VKIVVISPRFPYPLEKGDKLRLYHQLRILSKRAEIILISLSDIDVDQKDIDHLNEFISQIHIFKLSKIGIGFRLLKGIFSDKPFQILYFYNSKIKNKIHQLIRGYKPDFIFNQLIRTTEYSKELDSFKVLDYMDSFSQGMKKRFDNSSFPYKAIYRIEHRRLKKYEKGIFNYFDKHGIISEQDRDTFEKDLQGRISVIPNGVDMEFFTPIDVEKKYQVSFVGNMGYRPNVIASEFLVKDILPLLKKKVPGIKLLLAGARPSNRVKVLESDVVKVSGWVDDIRNAYGEAEIFVAPIFTGIGQQNKILEAMSMGIPVVTTTSVNKAIGAKPNNEILIADNAKEFSIHIYSLLNDAKLAHSIGIKGRKFVQNNYSWEFQGKKLLCLFEK